MHFHPRGESRVQVFRTSGVSRLLDGGAELQAICERDAHVANAPQTAFVLLDDIEDHAWHPCKGSRPGHRSALTEEQSGPDSRGMGMLAALTSGWDQQSALLRVGLRL
jgi:hypothetical protein